MKNSFAACFTVALLATSLASAEESDRIINLASGRLTFAAPAEWESKQPKNRMIEVELSVAPPEDSSAGAARLTIMSAGGGVEANLTRWTGQFQQKEADAKIDKSMVDGMTVTRFDLSGTFLQSAGGPFGPKTPRPGYRMLAAIVETGDTGNYFFKCIGPAETVSPHAERFDTMIASIKKSTPGSTTR